MGKKYITKSRWRGNAVANPAIPALPKLLVILVIGLIQGCIIGFVFMGTSHAFMKIGLRRTSTSTVPRKLAQQQDTKAVPGGKTATNTVHILCTSNGSPYQNYQMRIAYATYKLIQKMPGGEQHVGFTRILHRTVDDELMNEVPTFRADPLQPACDNWCEYPVSDRANVVRQFFEAAAKDPKMIKAPWIYMIESDYVFMKPLQLPELDTPLGKAFAYPFDYISPRDHVQAMKKLYNGNANDIPNTGPAPLLMKLDDWIKVTPEWEVQTAAIEADEALKKELGWVREMYGFSVALAKNNIDTELAPAGQSRFICQMPMEDGLGNAHAFHYTQCTIYKTFDDKDVWGYDKRFYTAPEVALKVPMIDEPPAFQEGKWKFIEGNPVTKEKHEAISQMIHQMNLGIETLKDLS